MTEVVEVVVEPTPVVEIVMTGDVGAAAVYRAGAAQVSVVEAAAAEQITALRAETEILTDDLGAAGAAQATTVQLTAGLADYASAAAAVSAGLTAGQKYWQPVSGGFERYTITSTSPAAATGSGVVFASKAIIEASLAEFRRIVQTSEDGAKTQFVSGGNEGVVVEIDNETGDVTAAGDYKERYGAGMGGIDRAGAVWLDERDAFLADILRDGTQRFGATRTIEAEVETAYVARQFRGRTDRVPGRFAAQVNLVIWLGQSWSMGFDAFPPINMVSRYAQVLTFNGGVRQQATPDDDAEAMQSFVAGVETQVTGSVEFPSAVLGETGAIAFGDHVLDLIQAENNIAPGDHDYRLLMVAPGEGSQSIEQLGDPDGVFMGRIQAAITQAYAICQAEGLSFAVPAITWQQGQGASDEAGLSGDTAAEYPQELENIRLAVQAMVDAIIDGHDPVKLITWQAPVQSSTLASQGSAKLTYQRQVSGLDAFPHLVCSNATYQYQCIAAGNVHLSAWGQAEVGRDFALAFKRVVIDETAYKPLVPVSLKRQGRVAILETSLERGALALDTSQVAAATDYGFNLYTDAASTTPLDIESLTLTGSRIVIRAASSIPADAELGYADTGSDLARSTRWRGNVRDNGADYAAGRNRWLAAFRIPFGN